MPTNHKTRTESPADRLRPVGRSFSYDISPARSALLSRRLSREPSIVRRALRFDRRHGPFFGAAQPHRLFAFSFPQRPKRLCVIRQSPTDEMHLK